MSVKKHISSSEINALELFRMPWTMADNSLTWLEPTRKCNITCDACFCTNDPHSEKSLQQIENEVKAMLKMRRCDGMLIAGGEPLTHPQIVEVVKIVKAHNVKPMLLTNGVGLESDLVRDLKKAGLFGFTFHVDSHQSRPGWIDKNEEELNTLRQNLADMVHKIGGLTCGFNITVFPDTIQCVPEIVEWAIRNIDRVQSYTLTVLRLVEVDGPFDYYVGDKKIDISETVFYSLHSYEKLTSSALYSEVRKVIPDFKLCAFLGGTVLSNSLKWAVGCRIGSTKKTYGNMGPKSMELIQNIHHAFTGRFLSFTKPSLNRKAKSILLFGLFDREVRRTVRRYFSAVIRNPIHLIKRLYVQNIIIEQPVDILPTGEPDICDGCPNKTLWKDRLISACLLEFYLRYDAPVIAVPRTRLE